MKVPSGELTNLPYLRKIAALNKKVILSTGMANLEEIEQALLAFETEGLKRDKVTVLQCTTDYPAPMADINLRAMETIKNKLGVKVGYSDHTRGWEVAIAAAALGAEVIEKHFTLDRNLIGPDHAASLEPDELFKMIVQIRNVELAMGSAYKRPSIKELSNSKLMRKSIFAKTKIHIGEKFSSDNLTTKRPGSGISPMKWDSLIGQNSIKNYDKDEQICVSELVRS
jgi:N,N'-diacetyllegionaminate synthase